MDCRRSARRLADTSTARAVRALGTAAVALTVLSGALVSTEREVGACSCGGPDTTLLGPDRVDDTPLNTKVRVEVPAGTAPGSLLLRVHGRAAPLPAPPRVIAPGGWTSFVELTPIAPLEPSTRYEVVTVDASKVPPNRVFGTFTTGRAEDTTAPRIDAMGPAIAYKNTNVMGSMCMVPGPWVTIEGVVADDPGRGDAQLVFAVWLGDASGAIDTKRPPTALTTVHAGRIDLGQTSLCDPHAFPFPKAPVAWLGIAAVDEAGNTSALRRLRVDLAGARQR
ncbi:MAG: hypothetical protein JWO86_3683 [Myxococcaceae bacterium]|nr:hypothetical protein [Myxococcaceae bacterium]